MYSQVLMTLSQNNTRSVVWLGTSATTLTGRTRQVVRVCGLPACFLPPCSFTALPVSTGKPTDGGSGNKCLRSFRCSARHRHVAGCRRHCGACVRPPVPGSAAVPGQFASGCSVAAAAAALCSAPIRPSAVPRRRSLDGHREGRRRRRRWWRQEGQSQRQLAPRRRLEAGGSHVRQGLHHAAGV